MTMPATNAITQCVSITFAQAVVLLALSRDEQPTILASVTRTSLLRMRLMAPLGRRVTSRRRTRRHYEITDAGRLVLEASPQLAKAKRLLNRQTKKRNSTP